MANDAGIGVYAVGDGQGGKSGVDERWRLGVGTARVHCVVRWRHKGIGGGAEANE